MSGKTDIGSVVVGSSMAAGPSLVSTPFYQTETWLAVVAITGFVVLILTGLNIALNIRKTLKWNGKNRRSKR